MPQTSRLASLLILLLLEPMSLQCQNLSWARVVRSFLVSSFSEMLINGGRSSNTRFLLWLLTAWSTVLLWIAWSVAFLSYAIIIGSTVLQCLVNSVSFIRLLEVSLVVMELLTFSGSRHLAKYCADKSSECSLTFSTFASACRWSTRSNDLGLHVVEPSGNKRRLQIEITTILTVCCSSQRVFCLGSVRSGWTDP